MGQKIRARGCGCLPGCGSLLMLAALCLGLFGLFSYLAVMVPLTIAAALPPAFWAVLACVVGWLVWLAWRRRAEKHRWRDLETLRGEYEKLCELLREQQQGAYLEQTERLVLELCRARDRAEKIRQLFQEKAAAPGLNTPGDERMMASLSNLRSYRDRYEEQKRETLALFQTLRIKALDSAADLGDLDRLVARVEGIRYLAEHIDGEEPVPLRRPGVTE